MRVFAYEFITGGGFIGEDLPRELVGEASMMVGALARDLSEVREVSAIVSQDPRVDLPKLNAAWLIPHREDSPVSLIERGFELCDALWPIAPETGGALERISAQALAADKILLGSKPETVKIAASKFALSRHLRAHGIDAVPTFRAVAELPDHSGVWVIKPDDGAGCLDTFIKRDRAALEVMLRERPSDIVAIQPWCEGEALSLSMLCKDGKSALLSVNSQHVFMQDKRVSVDALTVNVRRDARDRFARLANEIAAALPGLWGYVGVDLVEQDDKLTVLEVNPRLTTSYCGLREALNINVAKLVLDLLQPGAMAANALGAGKPVDISLTIDYAG
jgi:tyramine---L-glutamate ligase